MPEGSAAHTYRCAGSVRHRRRSTETRSPMPVCRPSLLLFPALMGLLVLGGGLRADTGVPPAPEPAQMRQWVDEMKTAPRGPFWRIRWFCADGTILPPEPYACRPHGGGVQHGEWSERTRAIRDQGYLIATLLAGLEPGDFTGPDARLDTLRQILLERFLIRNDDGWVFRQARYYRGAIQVEDEYASARRLLLAMVDDPGWRDPARYLLLREAARLLPIDAEQPATVTVRHLSTQIAEQDPGFQDLRIKLHGMPDAGDAQRVRDYAARQGLQELADAYRSLAAALDALYGPQTAVDRLERLMAEGGGSRLRAAVADAVGQLNEAADLEARLHLAASFAGQWRGLFQEDETLAPADRLRLLQAGLAMEHEVYAVGNWLMEASAGADRLARLNWLRSFGMSLFAAGLLSERQWQALDAHIDELVQDDALDAEAYFTGMRYLSRVSQWAQRALEFHFEPTVNLWSDITPLGVHFVPDTLRGGPLLPYTRTLDVLLQDANVLAGVRQELFGREVAGGLRPLNPGLARGVLLEAPEDPAAFRRDGIYLLPSTTPELPPVSGILTRGEGSSLSHVQLLARNLGIPNVVIDDARIPLLDPHMGARVVVAVSPRGGVRIAPDGVHWDEVLGAEALAPEVVIAPDLGKLDLHATDLLPLEALRAEDAGRRVGPKAANLGELRHHYPQHVNPGVVIPFGVFRAMLDQPIAPDGPAAYDWLRDEYARLHAIADPARREAETRVMLGALRNWIETTDPGDAFRARLREALEETFGSADTPGVFVRSDTNVEDLPGFTGAGLNLTVPNVVGFESIVRTIRRVWASPFSERAYAWRQAHMPRPEHVYPSVLLLQTFPSQKSGVLVTADVDTGDRNWLSIATSEGVGGAVDGQAAEELRVHRATGEVRLLSQASAPLRAEPVAGGGMRMVPASGRETVLTPHEIDRLRALVDDLPSRMEMPSGPDGTPVAADIEFGFSDGRLSLFQIRPFVESRRARQSQYLIGMDLPETARERIPVDLRAPPLSIAVERSLP